MTEKTEAQDPVLVKIENAMKSDGVNLHLVKPMAISAGGRSLGVGVQVKIANRKVGPVVFPAEGETVADVLAWLGGMAVK